MVKTVAPGAAHVPHVGKVELIATPDAFDERDLDYRPRLQPLPDSVDRRPPKAARRVLQQKGYSCVGHAVAAMVNAALPRRTGEGDVRVSPYMLYALARRYDEFPGDDDAGSSLRGALRGWYHHGVVSEDLWPDESSVVDLESRECRADAARRPLGAFYRINPYRLDDMQSALNELDAVVVTAVLHDGWLVPRRVRHGQRRLQVIARPVDAALLGGHAFALVGYNEVGFLVQNSWGTRWGEGGFATLPYEDWLDSAYDAWVARPGVPHTPFARGRAAAPATGGERALAPAPDLRRLAAHVVNLGNDGLLSDAGRFASTPTQLRRITEHMGRWHDLWLADDPSGPSRIVLFAHGGLTSEVDGLAVAQKHLNWWLNNRVYPVTFAWQSGVTEVLLDALVDAVRNRLPAGGPGFDVLEQVDKRVENIARERLAFMWEQMKQNARAASAPAPQPSAAAPGGPRGGTPGATVLADLLQEYVRARREPVELHLVGHSAGAIFHAGVLARLRERRLPVRTFSMLAPAIRVDEFAETVLPLVQPSGDAPQLNLFLLDEQRELDDVVGLRGLNVYQKSLLFLVSRGFERGGVQTRAEVPLLGMARFLGERLPTGRTVREAIEEVGGVIAVAPVDTPDDARTDSARHGEFDDNTRTMTSVLLRILRQRRARGGMEYRAHAALHTPEPASEPTRGEPPRAGAGVGPDDATPDDSAQAAAVRPPGAGSVVDLGEPQTERPAPPQQELAPVLEVDSAPRTASPAIDILLAEGWTEETGSAEQDDVEEVDETDEPNQTDEPGPAAP